MESSQQQRTLIALVLIMGIFVVWNYVFPPPKPVKPAAVAGAPELARTSSTSRTSSAAVGRAAAPPAMPEVAREHFTFEGSVSLRDGSKPTPYRLHLTNVGGAIESFELPTYFERDGHNQATGNPVNLALPAASMNEPALAMAGLRFSKSTTFEVPAAPVYEVAEKTERSVRYRFRTREGVLIEREYWLDPEAFTIEMAVTVSNQSPKKQTHQLAIQTAQARSGAMDSGFFLLPPPDHLNGACYSDERVHRSDQKSLVKESERFDESVRWAGVDRQYFLAAVVQRDATGAACLIEGKGEHAFALLELPSIDLAPGEQQRHKFTAYLGLKKPQLLTRVDAQLEAAVDYRILGLNLAIFCEALLVVLGFLHKLTASWGVAILGLTVLVKLILFPLNQRSGRSMRAMSALRPEMDKLKKKFPGDQQRQSEELMKLYRQHNVNPASGCVPVLIQMPIWFSLYRALSVSVDLYQQPFLWMSDLTARDPYFILPVLLIVVMYFQQKLMPNSMDPAQQKVMLYVMPLMFGAMMATLPAGLCFYIFVNSLLTIVQQHFINRSIGPMNAASEQGAPA